MLKRLWKKLYKHRDKNKVESLTDASKATGVPRSTIHHHDKRRKKREKESGTKEWDTAWGQNFLKRMIISVIYTFGIKGGSGAGRISEHLGHLQLEGIAAVSESSIQRLTYEISSNILWYKKLQEEGLEQECKTELEELQVVLGLDETWLDEMLLICQELTSGYLFLKNQGKVEAQKVGGKK
jgi:hypothetical protein